MILWSFENYKIAPARAINCDFVKSRNLTESQNRAIRKVSIWFCDHLKITKSRRARAINCDFVPKPEFNRIAKSRYSQG